MRLLFLFALILTAAPLHAQSFGDLLKRAQDALDGPQDQADETDASSESAAGRVAALKPLRSHGALPDGCAANTTRQCARPIALDQRVEDALTDAAESQFFEFHPGQAGVLRVHFERVLNDKATQAILYDEHGDRLGNIHSFQAGAPGVIEVAVAEGPVVLLYNRHRVPTSSPEFAFRAELVTPEVQGKAALGPTSEQASMGCGPNTTSQCAWSVPMNASVRDRFAPNAAQKHYALEVADSGALALDLTAVPLEATTSVVVYDQHRREIARQRFGNGTPGRLDVAAPGGMLYLSFHVDRPVTHPQFAFEVSRP